MLVKLRDYERMGVPTIMLIDPPTQTIFRFVNGELEAVLEDVQPLNRHPGWIDWRQVRELLDE